jgi:hypothetical protein
MSGPGLLKDLDEVFQNSEQRVLAAFVVSRAPAAVTAAANCTSCSSMQ